MASLFDTNWRLTLEDIDMENTVARSIYNSTDNFELPDHHFVKIFRLNKTLADELIDRLAPFMEETVIDSETKVCIIYKIKPVHKKNV